MRRVRVRYKKTDAARFISHLDLVRTFSRAIRRAGLRVYYSEGFNPHIKLTFLPPISLGYESECEAFDMRMLDDMSDDEIVRLLRATLPEELYITEAYETNSEFSDIAAACYGLRFAGDKARAAQLLHQQGLMLEKRTKRGQTQVDISALLLSAEPSDDGSALDVVLPVNENSVNPRLVIEALNTYGAMNITDFAAIRKKLFSADGIEFR